MSDRYTIVHGQDAETLAFHVNVKLDQGYDLVGHPFYSDRSKRMYQALIKPVKPDPAARSVQSSNKKPTQCRCLGKI